MIEHGSKPRRVNWTCRHEARVSTLLRAMPLTSMRIVPEATEMG
jgi:hypothetical protein